MGGCLSWHQQRDAGSPGSFESELRVSVHLTSNQVILHRKLFNLRDSVRNLRLRAEGSLARGGHIESLSLRGKVLDDGATLEEAGLHDGDCVTGNIARRTCLCSTFKAVAALQADGSIAVWLDPSFVGINTSTLWLHLTQKRHTAQRLYKVLASARDEKAVVADCGQRFIVRCLTSVQCSACCLDQREPCSASSTVPFFMAVGEDASVIMVQRRAEGNTHCEPEVSGHSDLRSVYSSGTALRAEMSDGSAIEWRQM